MNTKWFFGGLGLLLNLVRVMSATKVREVNLERNLEEHLLLVFISFLKFCFCCRRFAGGSAGWVGWADAFWTLRSLQLPGPSEGKLSYPLLKLLLRYSTNESTNQRPNIIVSFKIQCPLTLKLRNKLRFEASNSDNLLKMYNLIMRIV